MNFDMTRAAYGSVLLFGVDTAADTVRIVARGAKKFTCAPQKTLRLPQTICGVVDRDRILSGRTVPIEIDGEITERFSRPIRKRTTIKSPNRVRYAAARRLEMALQTDFRLPVETQPRRIQNWASPQHMSLTRAVAPLAIDPVSKPAIRFGGISVVTEKAGIRDRPPEIRVIRAIVTRAHCPMSTLVRIPAQRQLGQFAILVQRKVRA
jgi:hypothetical protein